MSDDDSNHSLGRSIRSLISKAESSNSKGRWEELLQSRTRALVELEQCRLATNATKEALEIKRVYLRLISHEMRSPLNVVISGLELLRNWHNRMSEDAVIVVREIKSACSSAISILDDLLTEEKLDGNSLQIDKAPCNISTLVEVCLSFRSASHPLRDFDKARRWHCA